MPELAFLLVGRTDRAEFAEVRASLAELGAVLDAVDPIVAESLLRQHSPDVIVLAQAFPGEFSSAAVDRLRVRAPRRSAGKLVRRRRTHRAALAGVSPHLLAPMGVAGNPRTWPPP
jgi:hypothetical protein